MRSRFDQFAKQMSQAGLARGGTVHTDEEVSPDAGHIDVRFTPGSSDPSAALAPLGMLGRMGRVPCILEAFHKTPGGREVMDCVCKLHYFRRMAERREEGQVPPIQWIVSSGRPDRALAGLEFKPSSDWASGVYVAPELTGTWLVVVSELPETRDTLLLRLMGAGQVFARAAAELRSLSEGALERALALPILLRLRLEIPAEPMKRNQEDEEFAMSTQDIVERYLEEQRNIGRDQGIREGIRLGEEQGIALSLLDIYATRFGPPPSDVSAAAMGTHDQARLRAWVKLATTGSAEEVRAAIVGQPTS